jgi:tRNA dimethylallyltransferase
MNPKNNKKLIVVCGPTAVGKTKFAIELAKQHKTEIISFDSRQFYKEMSIGTAVPSKQELAEIPHHFIQNKSIHEPYSVGDYQKEAKICMDKLFKKFDTLIMVGGSGLYEKAITKGLDDFPTIDPSIRDELESKFQTIGISYLQKMLSEKDFVYYEKVDKQNHRRLIRALEVCLATNKPYSTFLNKKEHQPNDYEVIKLGLEITRELLYKNINKRVDEMITNGLLDEVKQLYPHKHLLALQTVGYRELFDYIDHKFTLEEAIEEMKKNTRRYAKRQLTWYRKEEEVKWVNPFKPI